MLKYIIKRLLMLIPILLGAITIIFILSLLTPGHPEDMLLGIDATPEQKEELREELGLNDPFYERYFHYVAGVVTRFDLGTSYSTGNSVTEELMERLPITLFFASSSMLLALLISLPLGIIAAVRRYTLFDNVATVIAVLGVSIPQFFLGLLLMILFALKLNLLPASGISNPMGWILPICTMGFSSSAVLTRTVRSSMLEVMDQDYIKTARSKGVVERVVVLKHELRNALIPILTTFGGQLCFQLGGALVVEQVFAIPGIGRYIVEGIGARDFPKVQGGVVIIALISSILMLAVDFIYTVVDPRLKTHFTGAQKRRPSAPRKEVV